LSPRAPEETLPRTNLRPRLRIAFLIRSLDAGGAERQLVDLVTHLDQSIFDITVLTYYPGGALAPQLEAAAGVRLIYLGKRGRRDVAGFVARLVRHVRDLRPAIIHGYMPDANGLAWLLGRLTGARVVWGIRASDVDLDHYDLLTRLLHRTEAWLSPHADLIIANSEAGSLYHARQGYSPRRMVVIPNGIDADRFRHDAEARRRLRHEWHVGDDEFVLGVVARLDPMKDHQTFLNAAALLATSMPRARCVIVGDGPPEIRRHLTELADQCRVSDRLLWLGARHDMPAVYNALDVTVSSSAFGEGFSNTIGEAMACEVPCAATDVGDAAMIIADTGRVVPRRRPDLLAAALVDLANADRAALGRMARDRIVEHFSTQALVERTTAALCGLE
jgi:glycosyltransferase involved in cell wall biosynthesis